MISPVTGDVSFSSGLCFAAQAPFALHAREIRGPVRIPVLGWIQRYLGVHASEHGEFEVEAVFDTSERLQSVFLSHAHRFYLAETPQDAERRIFHESVLRTDLQGQLDFSWGRAYCRFDEDAHRDWLIVLYSPGPHVPLPPHHPVHSLTARLPESDPR